MTCDRIECKTAFVWSISQKQDMWSNRMHVEWDCCDDMILALPERYHRSEARYYQKRLEWRDQCPTMNLDQRRDTAHMHKRTSNAMHVRHVNVRVDTCMCIKGLNACMWHACDMWHVNAACVTCAECTCGHMHRKDWIVPHKQLKGTSVNDFRESSSRFFFHLLRSPRNIEST